MIVGLSVRVIYSSRWGSDLDIVNGWSRFRAERPEACNVIEARADLPLTLTYLVCLAVVLLATLVWDVMWNIAFLLLIVGVIVLVTHTRKVRRAKKAARTPKTIERVRSTVS